MQETGFWYSVGRFFGKCFRGLEWTYNHLSPNVIFIILLFVCFTWWMLWQHKYNKKAAQSGGYK
jgi:membrane protein DedA with SNARE-associated domain